MWTIYCCEKRNFLLHLINREGQLPRSPEKDCKREVALEHKTFHARKILFVPKTLELEYKITVKCCQSLPFLSWKTWINSHWNVPEILLHCDPIFTHFPRAFEHLDFPQENGHLKQILSTTKKNPKPTLSKNKFWIIFLCWKVLIAIVKWDFDLQIINGFEAERCANHTGWHTTWMGMLITQAVRKGEVSIAV